MMPKYSKNFRLGPLNCPRKIKFIKSVLKLTPETETWITWDCPGLNTNLFSGTSIVKVTSTVFKNAYKP